MSSVNIMIIFELIILLLPTLEIQFTILLMQQLYNLSTETIPPQLLQLKHKLIRPTVLNFTPSELNHIDTQHLKIPKKKQPHQNSQQLKQFLLQSIQQQKKQQSFTKKDDDFIHRKRQILPPIKNNYKIHRQNTSFNQIYKKGSNPYLQKRQAACILEIKNGRKTKNKIENYSKNSLAVFLKRNKSQMGQKKMIVYYKPQQVKRSLPPKEFNSVRPISIHLKTEKRLEPRYLSRRIRSKTSVDIPKRQTVNLFQLQTQFTQPSYISLEQLLQIDTNQNNVKNIKKIPLIPNKQNLRQFIKQYEPCYQDIDMKKLLKSNFCSIQQTNNELFIGQMVGKVKSGMGILFTHQFCFQGFWKNNQMIKGAQIIKEGVYKGEFQDNYRHGQGEFQSSNGQLYVGDWAKGLQNGQGLWVDQQGNSYKGQWKNGIPQGLATLTINDTNKLKLSRKYRGAFVNCKQSGFGRQYFANGDCFEGMYKQGKPSGKGFYTWANGSSYQGDFYEGIRQGMGTLKTCDNSTYKGEFLNDLPQGQCEITLPNGDTYYGMVKGGRKNGKGTLRIKKSRQIYNGYWKDDYFVNQGETD